jgi:Flp pilus assembly protein TadB
VRAFIPEEYRKFLEEEVIARKLSFYEKFCKFFSFFKFPVPKNLGEKYEEEIEFTHLALKPSEIFSSSIIFPFLLVFFSLPLVFFGYLEIFLMVVITCGIIFYFLLTYPHYYKFVFRTKASSETMLAIVYLVIALRIYKNLDKAVAFAAKNLTGPLGRDFKEALWDVYSGEKTSIAEALDDLSRKWHVENEEFSEALSMIKASTTSAEPEKNLDYALNLVLESTVTRMESYAREMKTPIALINMFGILLPLLGLVIFPVLFLMLPEIGKPEIIAFLYNVVLFLAVYLLLRQNLSIRPYSFHQPELTRIKKIAESKRKYFLISIFLGLMLIALSASFLFSEKMKIFSERQFLLSIFLVSSFFAPLIFYNFALYIKNSERNKVVLQAESELPTALRNVSVILKTGKPVESSINEAIIKMREMKIRNFFEKIIANIRLGLSFFPAIFDEKAGAIRDYPSRMIHAMMSVITEIGEKGSIYLSHALDVMSKYLSDAKEVSEKTQDILEEVSYDVKIQSLVLAPLTAGIVVGLTIFVLAIFFYLGGSLQSLQASFKGMGSFKDIASGGIFGIFNFTSLISAPYFQLIVGLYLLEVTWLMSYFYGELTCGDDEISKSLVFAKTLLIAFVLYVVVMLAIYYGIKSFINIEEFAKMVKI